MAKRVAKPKPLSSYEEDCIWMSYRYCIGRKTIASHMHAGNIAENAYHRLSNERMEFMAKDILEEIHTKLSFMDIRADQSIKYNNADFILIEELFKFYNDHKNDENFKEIVSMHYNGDGCWDIKYAGEKDTEFNKIFGIYRSSDIDDLVVWYKLAKCFMKSKHKIFVSKDDQQIEYFDCYERFNKQAGDGSYEVVYLMIKVPVDGYIKNPHVTVYLNEEFKKEN